MAVAVAFVSMMSASRADELRYTAVDLGTIVPGKEIAHASGINDRGQIAGSSSGHTIGSQVGFVTGAQGAGVRIVGASVTGINDSGATSGMTCESGKCPGFVMGIRGHHAVHLRPMGAVSGYTASGLSVSAQAAGSAVLEDGTVHAFRTDARGSNPHDLGTLTGRNSVANAINEEGRVCGSYWNSDSEVQRVFITDIEGAMRDAGFQGRCGGINVRGQLVGCTGCEAGRYGWAFVTGADGNNMRLLRKNEGALGSMLVAINRHGQAVGWEDESADKFSRAVVTDQRTERLYYLDALVALPPGSLSAAEAINDHGEIVAHGWDGHLYLLKPIR